MKYLNSLFAAVLVLWTSSVASADLPWGGTLRGYIDGALVLTDDNSGWTDRGPGRGRYGGSSNGERRLRLTVPEASLIADTIITPSLMASVQLKYDDEQRNAVDVSEAWLGWRSPPAPGVRWRVKLGTFFAPVSLENHALGWTSPYTISSSAMNTWVGEELRTNGFELRAVVSGDESQLDVYGALYLAGDTAGTLLAMRGWAIHDREIALFDRAPLPDYAWTNFAGGPLVNQSRWFDPLHEMDDRPGYYLGLDWQSERWGRFNAVWYDNRTDPELLDVDGQTSWHTWFGAVGYRGLVADNTTFIAQAMYGATLWGRKNPLTGNRAMDAGFFTAYALLSYELPRGRISARAEVFNTRDRDGVTILGFDTNEHGYAITLAWQYNLREDLRLTLEPQLISHERSARARAGLPREMQEVSVRANLRYLF
ncbi:MAG: hypothetical protein H6978_04630 [Gammaproteobacteria bacterium]|nr:hypothetical protein [Gammaproteobacteria bacterium]